MSPRDKILQRRARFVATAIAASFTAACSTAQACLEVAVADTQSPETGDDTPGDADTGPVPCLSDVGPPDTGSVDTSFDADASDVAETGATDAKEDG